MCKQLDLDTLESPPILPKISADWIGCFCVDKSSFGDEFIITNQGIVWLVGKEFGSL